MLAQRLDDLRRDTVLAARMLRRAPGCNSGGPG